MKKVNISEMRDVEGGAKYKCLICGKKSKSQTFIYWHVAGHKSVKLFLQPWDYIKIY